MTVARSLVPGAARPLALALMGGLALAPAAGLTGCNDLAGLAAAAQQAIPDLGFCGANVPTAQLAKLGEGPALFVDAVRVVSVEVAKQAKTIGQALDGGLTLDAGAAGGGEAIQALGPYDWKGAGTYTRAAAADRNFRLRFFYGAGVAGKAADAPLEADLTRFDSYVPNLAALLDPSAAKGPLFPLIEAAGFTGGKLGLRDEALRFDLGSVVASTIQGYGLQLGVGTARGTVGNLLSQLRSRQLALSLEDTALTQAASGFKLAIRQFDLKVGLDGQADLGGNYLFEVNNGALKYFGAVTTTAGAPALSLRCGEAAATEFATVSFVGGKADMKVRTDNFPITLPGLQPLYDNVKASL